MINKDLETFFNTNFVKLSKPMIKIFGLEAALMLCDLYSEYKYWESKKGLTVDGYFFSTVENVEDNVGLSRGQQLRAVKRLVEYGIIKKINRGMPSKRYFRFEYSGIGKLKKDIGVQVVNNNNQGSDESSGLKRPKVEFGAAF